MAYLAGVGTTWELPLGLGFLNLGYLVQHPLHLAEGTPCLWPLNPSLAGTTTKGSSFLLFIFVLIPHLVGASHLFVHLESQLSPRSSV